MSINLTESLRVETESRFNEDWTRQRRTATDILQRLQTQEGVILADQVGMGKTYVALAVAVNQILATDELGQVVIFVPAAVAEKWVREWKKFSETLLAPDSGIRCVEKPIRSAEEFLKKLDDSSQNRAHILVVTHTALTATLKDSFIQLALLYYATRYIKNGAELRQRIAKWSTGKSGLIRNGSFTPKRVTKLLETAPSKWAATWKLITGETLIDDPVPEALEDAARRLPLSDLRRAIETLPVQSSANIGARLEKSRKTLSEITQATWKSMLSATDLDLPLLIVDEAHRLKNPTTQISKLFGDRVNEPNAGALAGIFRRMLFLTATPFELGHSELIHVLRRMEAIRPMMPSPESPLHERLDELKRVLTYAQASALSLDDAWGRISLHELALFDNWGEAIAPPTGISAAVREAWEHAKLAVKARKQMHKALRPWVIRHERVRRRDYFTGGAILENGSRASEGLQIPDNAALPFLLAARAQSVAVDEKTARPLFAYGIASSYRAFQRLDHGHSESARDSDLADEDRIGSKALRTGSQSASNAVGWYRREIDKALAESEVHDAHPKVKATVEKASRLWLDGHKCLIFCWFIRTGESVEKALTNCLDALILKQASTALGTDTDTKTRVELDRIADRLFRRETSNYLRIRELLLDALTAASGGHADVLELVVDAAIRHLRTPSYLIRYSSLAADMTAEQVWAGVNGDNPRGIVLIDRWRRFTESLATAHSQDEDANPNNAHDSEFTRIKAALLGAETDGDVSTGRGASLHPVRRAHGGTARDIRERLIALFNTPLSPDLLVASSVMGEGIDLHQECRFVIHHDLDWNPGVLEQRTGRLDRIGALAEREGKHIEVYEPYLAGTHDEKMFRVVKDRSQWFDIVMGRPTAADELETDKEENRVPLHENIRKALAMDLRSQDQSLTRRDLA